MLTDEITRFWSLVERGDEDKCWRWLGSRQGWGYGQFACGPKGARTQKRAHRVAYELAKGPIPHGLYLDHLCRNRDCCNPDHLEAVGNETNIMRGESIPARNARKTHCKHGHELTAENIYTVKNQNGRPARKCKRCYSAYKARLYQRQKAEKARL